MGQITIVDGKTSRIYLDGRRKRVDLMEGADRLQIDIGEHGFAALVDCMPRLVLPGETMDNAIVQAARVSYGEGTKQVSEDKGLIRYLMRHMHTTPFEMGEVKMHFKMPIFVARQFLRHRTANVNEISGRYSQMPNEFFIPEGEEIRRQSNKNKQVSEGQVDQMSAQCFTERVEAVCDQAYFEYEAAIGEGVGREQARMLLPINLFTEFYWKIDLHNLLHFLALRTHEHAQKEIRDYADAMLELIRPLAPITVQAWDDYHHLRAGMKLSGLEVLAIKMGNRLLDTENKREQAEYEAKLKTLGGLYINQPSDE
jgi:thymidylate synthase (FAD)